MIKHAFGAIFIASLWSSLAFIALVAGQPSKLTPTLSPYIIQQTTSPSPTNAAIVDPVTINASPSITTWNDPCAHHRMEITGIGMGDIDTPINPQTITLTDPGSVSWLLAQVAGRRLLGLSQLPDSVTFSTSVPDQITLSTAMSVTDQAYIFQTELQPAEQITALVNQPGHDPTLSTPRGLILYARRSTTAQWTSVGRMTNQFVYWGVNPSHAETLVFPPLTQTTDLHITAAVIDNNVDDRPLVLEATAGGKVVNTTIPGPTEGSLLNIVSLTLSQVPTGTDQAVVTLFSPKEPNGDSLVLVGVNVSYRCGLFPPVGANFGLNKIVSNPTPREGDLIAYHITVTNNGPDDAAGVEVSDVLPTGITFDGYKATQGSYDNHSGVWAVNYLAHTAKAMLIITATVDRGTVGQIITNTASQLINDQTDLISGTNDSSAVIKVISGTTTGIYLPIVTIDYEPCRFYDFTVREGDWVENYSDPNTNYGYIDNEYQILARNPAWTHLAWPAGRYRNYIINAQVRWAGDLSQGTKYGLIFGIEGTSNNIDSFYTFMVYPDGTHRYEIKHYNRNDNFDSDKDNNPYWDTLYSGTSPHISQGSAINYLSVERLKSTITISANGTILTSITDSQILDSRYVGGGVGPYTPTHAGQIADVRFDNFQICPLEARAENPVFVRTGTVPQGGGVPGG